VLNAETNAILSALMESRKLLESKLEALDNKVEAMNDKLESVAADVAAMKEHLADMSARDQYLMQKTGELEAELFVVKRRQKA